ncbi:MAG TPA: tetratricopeptide repeat protein, partial [Candidatus Avalokitesvara rifleensis]|uniref:tetratricopeptide repeat protein n=1 Tax=Candidatus Avalokitesvara rifleensis TaxID=3367620 RepID=UPI0040273FFB
MTNESEHKYFHRLSCLIIVFVGLVVYSNTIHSSFHYDDYRSIVENPLIRDLSNIPQFFQENKYTSPSRGIVTTTFALNYYLSGLSVVSYHLVNIAIHLLNGVLVYLMAATILNQCIPRNHNTFRADVLALFVALLFVTSPVQTHTVTYVVQRNDELSSAFYLLSFIFFAKAVSQNLVVTPFYVLSIVFFLGGLWCKETAYTAFVMMFLYYLCFVSRGRHGWSKGLKLALPYVILAVVSIHIAVPVHQAPPLGLQLPIGKEVIPHVERPWQYPLTQTGVILEYIKLLAWPLPSRLNVDYDVTLADTFWELSTAASTIIIIGLLCTALVLLLLNRVRLLAFSVLWFLVILMPTSSIFPMGEGELMVCYRLYLPGLAFYLLLVAGIHKLFCHLGEKKGMELNRLRLGELAVLTGIVLFYSICAYEHNKVWKTEVSLWEDTVKKSPNKMRPHYNLGKAYERNGMLDKAKTKYFRCIEMFEGTPNSERRLSLGPYYHAGLSLASIYSSHGEYAKAIAMYKKCLTTVYWEADGHNNLGLTYYKAGYL